MSTTTTFVYSFVNIICTIFLQFLYRICLNICWSVNIRIFELEPLYFADCEFMDRIYLMQL